MRRLALALALLLPVACKDDTPRLTVGVMELEQLTFWANTEPSTMIWWSLEADSITWTGTRHGVVAIGVDDASQCLVWSAWTKYDTASVVWDGGGT